MHWNLEQKAKRGKKSTMERRRNFSVQKRTSEQEDGRDRGTLGGKSFLWVL